MGRRGEQRSDFERSEKSGVAGGFEGRGYLGGLPPKQFLFSHFSFLQKKSGKKIEAEDKPSPEQEDYLT